LEGTEIRSVRKKMEKGAQERWSEENAFSRIKKGLEKTGLSKEMLLA